MHFFVFDGQNIVSHQALKLGINHIEINDLYKLNDSVNAIKEMIDNEVTYTVIPPKSAANGHLGIIVTVEKGFRFGIEKLCEIENVVFVAEE